MMGEGTPVLTRAPVLINGQSKSGLKGLLARQVGGVLVHTALSESSSSLCEILKVRSLITLERHCESDRSNGTVKF